MKITERTERKNTGITLTAAAVQENTFLQIKVPVSGLPADFEYFSYTEIKKGAVAKMFCGEDTFLKKTSLPRPPSSKNF